MEKNISAFISECEKNWVIENDSYSPAGEAYWESIMALSNGYMGVRASLELASAGSLPGVYIAGVFDKPDKSDESDHYGLSLKNKAITPSYAIIPLFHMVEIIADGRSIDFCNCEIITFKRKLDMKRGLLFGEYALKLDGKITAIKTMTAVSKADLHGTVLRIEITPVNYGGELTVRFKNELNPHPQYIKRLKDYTSKTDLTSLGEKNGGVFINAKVGETGAEIAMAAQTDAYHSAERCVERSANSICEVFSQKMSSGETASFAKSVAFSTSRDCEDASAATAESLRNTLNSSGLLDHHIEWWRKAWNVADIEILGSDDVRLGLRWNIFSLMQLGSEIDSGVSISATGLHGQGYFGHAFWDTEIFMLPFFLATNPKVAKNLLLYRYNRLNAARTLAAETGCKGAKFPWTSTSDGFDSTPPDWERCAKRQLHISGDVAYAFRNYLNWTGDIDFFRSCGVEVIVETAKYYASRATKEPDGKYHILDVIGPDEYNIHADNNYYTNFLVQWNIKEALSAMNDLETSDKSFYQSICVKTGWSENTRAWLQSVADNLAFPRTKDGVNEQYQGFFNLPDIGKIERDEYNMPLDRSYHYDSGAQVLKQPDVVMMHYLFPNDFSPEVQRASYEYYENRCNHGSSLSPSIHCVQGLRCGLTESAAGYFALSTLLDLKNLHLDQNLDEGIHMACAGGSWACAALGIGGIGTADGKLRISPNLPKQLDGVRFAFKFRGRLFRVALDEKKLAVTLESGDPIEAVIIEKTVQIEPGQECIYALS